MWSHGQRLVFSLVLWPALTGGAAAQIGSVRAPELSLDVQLDDADNVARAHLERSERHLADGQWEEAVETLGSLMEATGDKVLRVPPGAGKPSPAFGRFLPIRDVCQLRLAGFSAAAARGLELYRQRTDPLAERWYKQALDQHDSDCLRRIVDRAFVSTYGDDALLRLGEWELEEGHFTAARAAWERISPLLRTGTGDAGELRLPPQQAWGTALHGVDLETKWPQLEPLLRTPRRDPTWLAYPDSPMDLAAVRARLVLTSILEGSPARAESELQTFRRLHPDAAGTLAGRNGRYAGLLNDQLVASRHWPPPRQTADWPTFGGAANRGRSAAQGVDVALKPAWVAPLPRRHGGAEVATEESRVAESPHRLLSYYPVVVGRSVWVATGSRPDDVLAFNLDTGRPLWEPAPATASTDDELPVRTAEPQHGVPRFTLTAAGKTLFAKLGPQATTRVPRGRPDRQELLPPGFIAALDMEAEKKLLFELRCEGDDWDAGWYFEGPPLVDGDNLYVALRRRVNVRSQAHVACFRVRANRARLLWRKLIASGETPGQGETDEYTHNLLTLDQGTLYLNTNLGAVAAVRAADGRLLWLVTYPRAPIGPAPFDSRRHWLRDVNPCLVHKDLVLVAPSDCDRVFALDAANGFLVWSTPPQHAVDAVHLLGVGRDRVLVSGSRLYWLNAHTGRVEKAFPATATEALGGCGRGVLAGDLVYWPTRDRIYVFQQSDMHQVRQPIDLTPMGLTGGNLVIAQGALLIAGAEKLAALR